MFNDSQAALNLDTEITYGRPNANYQSFQIYKHIFQSFPFISNEIPVCEIILHTTPFLWEQRLILNRISMFYCALWHSKFWSVLNTLLGFYNEALEIFFR